MEFIVEFAVVVRFCEVLGVEILGVGYVVVVLGLLGL